MLIRALANYFIEATNFYSNYLAPSIICSSSLDVLVAIAINCRSLYHFGLCPVSILKDCGGWKINGGLECSHITQGDVTGCDTGV